MLHKNPQKGAVRGRTVGEPPLFVQKFAIWAQAFGQTFTGNCLYLCSVTLRLIRVVRLQSFCTRTKVGVKVYFMHTLGTLNLRTFLVNF